MKKGVVLSMGVRIAQWVHGTSVQIEFPERLDRGNPVGNPDATPFSQFTLLNGVRRRGEGAYFRADRSLKPPVDNWFHFAIPTPAILDGARPELTRVYVLYKTFNLVQITNVHLYDGPNITKEFNNLLLSGAHNGAVDSSNEFLIYPPFPIQFGLGVSVRVEFIIDIGFDAPGAPDVLCTSAGADFIDSIRPPVGPFTT
jgi:hypothetical protein